MKNIFFLQLIYWFLRHLCIAGSNRYDQLDIIISHYYKVKLFLLNFFNLTLYLPNLCITLIYIYSKFKKKPYKIPLK